MKYCRLPDTQDAVTAAEAVDRLTGQRRALGITMPTIDYVAFKRLEARLAAANDPEVIRVAREAMTPPVERLKIRNVRKTAQAILVDKVLLNKVSQHSIGVTATDAVDFIICRNYN